MALDTKEKRAAVIGVGRPWMRDKFPVVTPDEEWRISSGNAYGGNALSPPTGVDELGASFVQGGHFMEFRAGSVRAA